MFINKQECKRFMLEMSKKHRNGKFKRVGQDVFEHLNFELQRKMVDFVRMHPSLGVTLKTGTNKRKSIFDGEDGREGKLDYTTAHGR